MLEGIIRKKYKVAIYIRLSKEDVNKGYDESESIINQKSLLTDYVKKLGYEYELIDIYADQGYTGTNFNRPDFKRMVSDIELGKINMVVTKDLSRLGRDYIETGEYIEKWFPEKNVRYISVTDGIDTFETANGNNDIAPFKSILNDMYSKDLSKKIKTAMRTMQKQGKWVGGKIALGYKKDPMDKNKLVVCEEEAEIVKLIFNMAKTGATISSIKNYLNENNIPTASKIRYNRQTYWENKAIKLILSNEIYTGVTIQNKRSRINYKNRKLRLNPKEQWIIVENTHTEIIDKKTFDIVQKMKITQKCNRNEKKYHFLLDGLLICYECKHKIGIKKDQNGRFGMVCNNYRKNSKLNICTSHGFSYNKLEDTILKYIKNLFLDIDNRNIEINIKNSKNKFDYEKMLKKFITEINLINNNIDKMYIDKLNNKISEEMYERLLKKLEEEKKEKEKQYLEIKNIRNNSGENDNGEIEKLVKEYLKLEKPTPELMRAIINKIEIHQDKQVDIVFNFSRLNNLGK